MWDVPSLLLLLLLQRQQLLHGAHDPGCATCCSTRQTHLLVGEHCVCGLVQQLRQFQQLPHRCPVCCIQLLEVQPCPRLAERDCCHCLQEPHPVGLCADVIGQVGVRGDPGGGRAGQQAQQQRSCTPQQQQLLLTTWDSRLVCCWPARSADQHTPVYQPLQAVCNQLKVGRPEVVHRYGPREAQGLHGLYVHCSARQRQVGRGSW